MSALLLAFALQVASPAPTDDGTIVVTATLAALREAWARCKAGGCTPRQDAVASIRYAEVMFRDGRYRDARGVLQGAIDRNKAAGAIEPAAVAALYEATITVAEHDGDQDVRRHATGARLALLRQSYGSTDARLLQAQIDSADQLLGTSRQFEAASSYPVIARRAAAAGLPMIQALAVLRQATLAHAYGQERTAKRLLAALVAEPSQSDEVRTAARALMARFARDSGDSKPIQALVSAFIARGAEGPPVLVWQPPLPAPGDEVRDPTTPILSAPVGSLFTLAPWVDVGFLIKPDGTVDPPEVLRGSRATDWSRPLLRMIAGRRYLPLGADSAARYRIERWTLTGDYCVPQDSQIRRRACNPHFAETDLTGAAPPSPSS